jgi:hypothetical protein
MKRFLEAFVAIAAVFFMAGMAKAQSAPAFGRINANVPFEFYAGDTKFPAGSYVIQRLNESEPKILTISTADGRITALLLVHLQDLKQDSKTSEISFNKYGSRFFLSGVTVAGYSNGSMVDKSHFEDLVGKGEVAGEGRRVPAQKSAQRKK